MEKRKTIRLKDFSKNILLYFLKRVAKYRHELFLFVVFSSFFIILSFFPYFNLIMGNDLLLFLILLSYLIFFEINYKKCVVLGLSLLVVALPFILIGEYETAEGLANFTYGIFILCLIKFVFNEE